MNHFQPPLRINAAFSLATGLFLVAAPRVVGDWLGLDAELVLRLFGIALLGHATLLFWAATQPNPERFAYINFLAIAPYPVLMIGLVAGGVIDRPLGQVLAIIDGAIIAALSVWQWRLLKDHRTVPIPNP